MTLFPATPQNIPDILGHAGEGAHVCAWGPGSRLGLTGGDGAVPPRTGAMDPVLGCSIAAALAAPAIAPVTAMLAETLALPQLQHGLEEG